MKFTSLKGSRTRHDKILGNVEEEVEDHIDEADIPRDKIKRHLKKVAAAEN